MTLRQLLRCGLWHSGLMVQLLFCRPAGKPKRRSSKGGWTPEEVGYALCTFRCGHLRQGDHILEFGWTAGSTFVTAGMCTCIKGNGVSI